MRPPTRAFLRAVCRRLDLDPAQVTRVTLTGDRVAVTRLVPFHGGLLETTEVAEVPW